ncbi:toll/interleukin-1 receptor domain-containing protein [Kitasatospora sp. NPDC057015]|uniref:toll/interleukin-1 receptor domain-containing protein n=1 Tax=Kitasatospora sp. NPDC057015 TaxID=3346001 RepID=UPI003641CB02
MVTASWTGEDAAEREFDFFISYARRDEVVARQIRDVLVANGFSVVIDLERLASGAEFLPWMEQAIGASERILVIATPNYFDPSSYTAHEYRLMFGRRGDPQGRVVPLILEECNAEMDSKPLLASVTPIRLVGMASSELERELVRRLTSPLTAEYPVPPQRVGDQVLHVDNARSRDCFTLGPLRTTWRLVEGDGQQPLTPQRVRVEVEPAFVELPDDMVPWYEEIRTEQEQRRARGLPHRWNGNSYAVSGLSIGRTPTDESPDLCLRLQQADYYTFLATQQLDRVLPDGTTPRSRYLDGIDPEDAPAFLSCSFGINVAVVTSDNHLVVSRRSGRVGSLPGLWSSSANEALSRDLDSQGRTPPDLFRVARRGLEEELSIQQHECSMELMFFGIDVQLQQWGAGFLARLRTVTAAQLQERRSQGVPDRWEHDHHEFVPFTVKDVVGYLLREDRRDAWTPIAPALFYLALVRAYGKRAVTRDTRRVLRELELDSGTTVFTPTPTGEVR